MPTATDPAPPPARVARTPADPALRQIGWLAGLLAVAVPGGAASVAGLAIWGLVALAAWLMGATGRPGWQGATGIGAGAGYLAIVILGLGLGRADLAGVALAPLAVLLLAMLLPRAETAPAAADWGLALVGLAWAATGVFGLVGLLAFPGPFGSAAVPVLGAVLAAAAGRRAARMQGFSERVAAGVGATLAVAGVLALGGSGQTAVLVLGTVLGLVLATLAPAPPAAAPLPHQAWTAATAVHQQLVFVAPLSAALLWLVRTLF